ncbi:MAG TPA: zinc metalloprotease HtpX [Actinomycetota bacterium]|jgi:heat shock protein HtpX|nr:zinc metalloprotease HtpX [Actinomycetota bacterium]
MTGRNYLKTTLLLAGLSGLLLFIGSLLQASLGGNWITIMLVVVIAMNGIAYFYSDKIAIRAARAVPVTEAQFPELYQIVRGLANKAGIPMPRLYVSPSRQPNAFATGRNPQNAAVAVTQGILPILDRRELEGVLAHELSHVQNRDILISSVAATIGAVITWVAHIAAFASMTDDDEGGNPLGGILMLILAPLAAGLIQMAISRSREFGADSSGARLIHDPRALASALRKIEAYSRGTLPATTNPSTAHLFISNPFKGGAGVASLFSTHPSTAERVERLERMAYDG